MHKHDNEDNSNDSNNNIKSDPDTSRKSENSPLRVALADKSSAAVVVSSLANPLLTASLNSPPVNLSANGSVDLTSSIRKRMESDGGHTSPSSSTSNKEMYANLLMQLRHQGITASEEVVAVNLQSNNASSTSKMTAAARKEKLKSQLCFQCPVCKKRFQRHIAMNAHFQAEHLGVTSKNDKVCKLCSYVGHDMAAIRNHLLAKHTIDLETPTACLVEPEFHPGASSPSCRSTSSSPLPSSSSDKKTVKHCFSNNNNSSSNERNGSPAVSIIRTSVVPKAEDTVASSSTSFDARPSPPANIIIHETTYRLKQEAADDNGEEAKDLSMKKSSAKRCTSPVLDLVHNCKKRLKSVNNNRIVMSSPSSPLNQDQVASPSTASVLTSQWQCQHCSIIFPDQTLYFLHRGFHSNTNPWRCNGCGQRCTDMYDFNTHLMSDVHH